jgi:activator of HSP90 ATPase
MIDTHGKDITVSANASRSGTPAPSSAPASASGAVPSTASASSTSVGGAQPAKRKEARYISEALNTTQVSVEASFMAAADDLFSLLTDERRIPAWSRSAATSRAKPETDYSIFDGNIVGKYISLTPYTEIKQTWMLKSPIWPAGRSTPRMYNWCLTTFASAGHMATLTTTLKQSSDSTTLILSLDGVPTGMEGMIRTNLEGYYMQGLKSIGYVQLIHYNPPPPSISARAISSPLSLRSNTRIAAVTFVALLAVFISYIHVFSSRE